jgi:uncharacterized protein YjcR
VVPPEHLVGAAEIAERLRVTKNTLRSWRRRGLLDADQTRRDFPEPIASLRGADVWDWREVEAWARATGRL